MPRTDLSDDVIGVDADLVEHGTEQSGLVFAIAVFVLEDAWRQDEA